MFCEIVLSAALFAVGQPQPLSAIPLTREAVLPPDVHLVKAHAVSATSLKIDHVYVGPGDLKEKTFVAELIYCKIVGMRGQRFKVPVPNGQPGIWWIKKEKGEFVAVFGHVSPWFIEDLLKTEIGLANAYTREGSGPPYGVWFSHQLGGVAQNAATPSMKWPSPGVRSSRKYTTQATKTA